MGKDIRHHFPAFSKFGINTPRRMVVLLLGLVLTFVPPQVVLGQANQQQEEQQRQQQQQEEQQREEQQRQQQQQEEQQREEQQRQQQQQEEQQREEQQRQQQQQEEQQREEQQRQQRQQEEQERQQQTLRSPSSDSPAAAVSPNSSAAPRPTQSDTGRAVTHLDASDGDRKVNTAAPAKAPATNEHAPAPQESSPRVKKCDNGPCKEPEPKPVQPDLHVTTCKGGPCPVCRTGETLGKNNSCVAAIAGKAAASAQTPAPPQACPAGQVWNGAQCALPGAQPCAAGQTMVGGSCHTDCTVPTAGAQNLIVELRSARVQKAFACTQNPNGKDCQDAEGHYNVELNEYRNYLGGVPAECILPDPISI